MQDESKCPDINCEYNKIKECGKSFCILPRCIKGDAYGQTTKAVQTRRMPGADKG